MVKKDIDTKTRQDKFALEQSKDSKIRNDLSKNYFNDLLDFMKLESESQKDIEKAIDVK